MRARAQFSVRARRWCACGGGGGGGAGGGGGGGAGGRGGGGVDSSGRGGRGVRPTCLLRLLGDEHVEFCWQPKIDDLVQPRVVRAARIECVRDPARPPWAVCEVVRQLREHAFKALLRGHEQRRQRRLQGLACPHGPLRKALGELAVKRVVTVDVLRDIRRRRRRHLLAVEIDRGAELQPRSRSSPPPPRRAGCALESRRTRCGHQRRLTRVGGSSTRHNWRSDGGSLVAKIAAGRRRELAELGREEPGDSPCSSARSGSISRTSSRTGRQIPARYLLQLADHLDGCRLGASTLRERVTQTTAPGEHKLAEEGCENGSSGRRWHVRFGASSRLAWASASAPRSIQSARSTCST